MNFQFYFKWAFFLEFNSRSRAACVVEECCDIIVGHHFYFRQLSVERDTLRNSLERESAKSKRLSLENEELQWRLVNSTSPPCTPTDEGGPFSIAKRNSNRLSASFPDVESIDE